MAFTRVQSAGTGASSVAEPIVKAYDSNVTAGNLLVAAVAWNSPSATCTVSDPVNGSWAAAGSPQTGSVGGGLENWRIQMFYKIGSAALSTAGDRTVTADVSSSVNGFMAIGEWSASAAVSLDGTPNYNPETGTATPTSGTVTTSVSGALLLAECVVGSSVSSAGTGYTIVELADFADNGFEEDLDGGAPGGKTASFNAADSTDAITGLIAFKEGGAATQTLLPSADSVDGNWTDQGGGTSLAAAIDETSFSDSDYIRSELGPSNSACRVKLAAGGDPATSADHIIHWRTGKDTTGGATIGMTVKLYQGGGNSIGGGTLIASFTRSNVDAFTTYDETLSSGEADSITNYTDLYLEFSANQT